MARLQQHKKHHSRQQLQKKKKNFSKKPPEKVSRERRRGPRLPSSLRKELYLEDHAHPHEFHEDAESEEEEEEEEESQLPKSVLSSDVYEYEENQAPEDSRKNRRFDDVDRFEYELPSDFEDEEIDEDAADGEDLGVGNKGSKRRKSSASGKKRQVRVLQSEVDDGDEEIRSQSDDLETSEHGEQEFSEGCDGEDDESEQLHEENVSEPEYDSDIEAEDGDEGSERHKRMIEAVRVPRKKELKEARQKHIELLSEAYPESEFNINPSADDNLQQVTVEDLMAPLQNTTGFGSLRKRLQQLEKKGAVVDAPLPKAVQDRLSRKAGYVKASEEISKWQDIVKRNREAATLVFTQRPDLTAASTAELVSKFEPTTNLEKEVASLLQVNGLAADTSEADTALGFNKLTMDEVKERQERLAKMRSMLSYHEAKAKRMKKIKSKTYHRLLQKDLKGKARGEDDPESLKEAAVKAEFKRAQERMTLKHKNTSRWAKRIIKRGLKAKEDGSREALAEQLHTHSALTRKIQSIDNASSSEESSDEMDSEGNDNNGPSSSAKQKTKLLAKAKMETLKVLEGDAEAEIPTSGLFSLPFMARAIEKKRKQAQNEAVAVLEQLEQLENDDAGIEDANFDLEKETATNAFSGRLAFGDLAKSVPNAKEQELDMLVDNGSSSDEVEYGEDRLMPAAEKTSVNSRKRKSNNNGSIDILNGTKSQGGKLRVTEEAWIDGVNGSTTFSASNEQAHEEVGIPLEVSKAEGTNVAMLANPWLYGAVTENESTATEGEKPGMREDIPGSLVTSVALEVSSIFGGKGKMDKKKTMAHNGVMPDRIVEEDMEQGRPLTSSDSEKDDDEGVTESGFRLSAENASQSELIQRAFAGDDVEADFQQMKSEALDEEVPLGEGAVSLPGWGQWTDVQKKRGPPQWIVKQQEQLKRSREQALHKRKDAKLKHVIISERMDKKAEKFMAPKLPFPFTSREVFERSIRMPIGREFNTDQSFRDMIRPAVIKDAGVIIDPIKYKMSETKTVDTIGNFGEKENGSTLEAKSKSGNRTNGSLSSDKRSEKRPSGFVSEGKKKGENRSDFRVNGLRARR